MSEHYTPFYEWAARWDELSLPEALLLCRIKMWGNAGCFESYATLAQVLKIGQRTVIRAAMSLHEKDLIKIVREGKYKRTLIFNFTNTNLPMFDKKVVPQRHKSKTNTATAAPSYATAAHQVMPQRHNTISSTKQDKPKDKINRLSDIMTIPKKRLSPSEIEKRRQKYLEQCKNLK